MKRPEKIEHVFNKQEDLKKYLLNRYINGELRSTNTMDFKHSLFGFHVSLPISLDNSNNQIERNLSNFLVNARYLFSECEFNSKTTINNTKQETVFQDNCLFNEQLRINNRDKNLTFKNCEIKNLDVSEAKFGTNSSDLGKLRIKSCEVYKTNFKNTTFLALVDFYYTIFYENVIFYKTDFLNIVVFSATTFKKNLLFTYTLLNDKVIMRATNFNKGFDFSLSIIKGQLAIFDINHSFNSYHSVDGLITENEYEKAVSYDGIIPTQNKLETYRLLKVEFENQKNISEHLQFKLYEKKTYKRILKTRKFTWTNVFDQITLWLNSVSNNHATSYIRAFFFILTVGWFFFYLSLISTKSYEFSLEIREWEISKSFQYFVQFLIPTHKFDYMGNDVSLTSSFFLFDFFGRMFVGYGIYQFIQAFRKFK
jgi:hypothetical protein